MTATTQNTVNPNTAAPITGQPFVNNWFGTPLSHTQGIPQQAGVNPQTLHAAIQGIAAGVVPHQTAQQIAGTPATGIGAGNIAGGPVNTIDPRVGFNTNQINAVPFNGANTPLNGMTNPWTSAGAGNQIGQIPQATAPVFNQAGATNHLAGAQIPQPSNFINGFGAAGTGATGWNPGVPGQPVNQQAGVPQQWPGQTPFNQVPFNQVPFNQSWINQIPFNQFGLNQTPYNQIPFNQFGLNQFGLNQFGLNQTPYNQIPFNQIPFNQAFGATPWQNAIPGATPLNNTPFNTPFANAGHTPLNTTPYAGTQTGAQPFNTMGLNQFPFNTFPGTPQGFNATPFGLNPLDLLANWTMQAQTGLPWNPHAGNNAFQTPMNNQFGIAPFATNPFFNQLAGQFPQPQAFGGLGINPYLTGAAAQNQMLGYGATPYAQSFPYPVGAPFYTQAQTQNVATEPNQAAGLDINRDAA